MTNREKLIELLTEKDGKVDLYRLVDLLNDSPLVYCSSTEKCGTFSACCECFTDWLNKEAKE